MSPSFLPAAESYNFDATGNRSTAQSTPGTHNRVQSDGNYTYEYDAEGNTTKRTSIADGSVREMVWDYRGRLTKLTDRSSASGAATLVVDYGYHALDRLSSKKITTGGSSKSVSPSGLQIFAF